MLPLYGFSSPAMDRNVVVLPQPEGPSKCHQLAGRDGEVDAIHRRGVAVTNDEVGDLDARIGGHVVAPVT